MRYLVPAIVLIAATTAAPVSANTKAETVNVSAASDPDQKIRCRKVEVTGSLVKKGRVCKTIAEWRAIISNGNDNARDLVEDGTTRPNGN